MCHVSKLRLSFCCFFVVGFPKRTTRHPCRAQKSRTTAACTDLQSRWSKQTESNQFSILQKSKWVWVIIFSKMLLLKSVIQCWFCPSGYGCEAMAARCGFHCVWSCNVLLTPKKAVKQFVGSVYDAVRLVFKHTTQKSAAQPPSSVSRFDWCAADPSGWNMKIRLSLATAALFAALLSSIEAQGKRNHLDSLLLHNCPTLAIHLFFSPCIFCSPMVFNAPGFRSNVRKMICSSW